MPNQNLISTALATELKQSIEQQLTEIKSQLNFLLALQPDDIQGLFKAGNNYYPFIDRAHETVTKHPEILPSVFNVEEFKKDYNLSKNLTPIVNQINELAEGLGKTLTAINSDALAAALDVYAAVKQNRDKVSGLNVVADEMSVFFQRTRMKTVTGAQPANK
jgi:hypothetical protein